ncbi:hypothetical protein ACLHWY_27385, partial [Priestia aryabhattai]|uniref:hypothetical protein n=1 Tax=Priestia aryabhattai TaxID=412384 RepID=UPI0039834E0C
LNLPFIPAPDACAPLACGDDPQPDLYEPEDPCEESGSIVECETQSLRETVPLAGTGMTLAYASDRVPGRTA